MPIQGPQWTEFLSCEVCYKLFSEKANRPISLGCGHTVCKMCLSRLQQSKCPFDQSPITYDIDKLPVNYALLQLVGAAVPDKIIDEDAGIGDLSDSRMTEYYESARKCIEELAIYLKPLSEESLQELEETHEDLSELKIGKPGSSLHPQIHNSSKTNITGSSCVLSRPMQRKLVTLINCQLVEEEGRSRATRAARSLGERAVTELILAHQNPQQLSANLWAAVRTRGCQFLGPGMQEEVLRLILLALEDGSALSRKVLVLFVVQRLEKQYPQASKTAIGHVVQLLYRASCFRVTKREEESSLMQLKEEFRLYEALRREHDAQIVQIAMEAGLRISPEQWSSLLYGDNTHKSHMQSIIDKHQSPQCFSQGISELVLAVQRNGDPCNLLALRPHLDFLAKIDPSPDCPAPSWEDLEAVMKSLKLVVQGLVDFLTHYRHRQPEVSSQQNARYKTSMCRDFTAKGSCPRGANCTFAHSQDELEKYRARSKKLSRGFGSGVAFGSLAMKHKMELGQDTAQNIDNSMTITDRESLGLQSCDMLNGDGDHVTANMSGLSLSPSIQTHPQSPSPGLPVHMATPLPAPGGAYAITQPCMSTSTSRTGPITRLTFTGTKMLEGLCADHLRPGLSQYPQAPMRLPTPPDMSLAYPNGHIKSLPMQGPSPLLLHPAMVGPPSSPGPVLQPPHGHHPHLFQEPGRIPEMPSHMASASATCSHHHISGELPSPSPGNLYSMGPSPGMGGPPYDSFMLNSAGELQSMTGAVSSMSSLEKLQNRKSEIISHLLSEGVGPGVLNGAIGISSLNKVLSSASWPDPLTDSVNDSYVAARTTHTLDDLGMSMKYPKWSSGEMPHAVPEFLKTVGNTSSYKVQTNSSKLVAGSEEKSSRKSYKSNSSESYSDLSEDGEAKEAEMKSIANILEDDDDYIPFDPPLVSKYGPISRKYLYYERGPISAPVQVTAEENSKKYGPVVSVMPYDRMHLKTIPVTSLYRPQMSTSVTQVTSTPIMQASMYSMWGGQDCMRHKIPAMVQQLEKSAIQATTHNERLALQLQAIELQISMKTGTAPKPVYELLQDPNVGKSKPADQSSQSTIRDEGSLDLAMSMV